MRELAKVVEKFYSPAELAGLWGFSTGKIRALCKEGAFILRDSTGQIVAQPWEIAGEIRIPASAINAYAFARPYVYDAGIKARNKGELLRKLATAAAHHD